MLFLGLLFGDIFDICAVNAYRDIGLEAGKVTTSLSSDFVDESDWRRARILIGEGSRGRGLGAGVAILDQLPAGRLLNQ